jgi:head-tail adaptor
VPHRRGPLHIRGLTHLNEKYPSRVRIERSVTEQDAAGEMDTTSWKVIYDNVPAAIMAVIRLGEEFRNWRLEVVLEQVTHRIALQGYYPDVLASDRLVTQSGEIHNITARHLDSHSRMTRLNTRLVSPEAIVGVG